MRAVVRLATGLFLLAAPCRAWDVDLGRQFPVLEKSQQNIGSCHAFASVGLLEAALYRGYHAHIELSEADLFIGNTLGSAEAYAKARKAGRLNEGNYVDRDLRFALDHGLATEATFDYGRMSPRYGAYREAVSYFSDKFRQDDARRDWIQRTFFKSESEQWLQAQLNPQALQNKERMLNGVQSRIPIADERALMKEAFAAFRIRKMDAATMRAPEEELNWWLDRKVPVSVSIDLGGLPNWGDFPKGSWHGIIIEGYRFDPDGSLVYKTRNSWGMGRSPDVPGMAVDSIREMNIVIAPGDPGSAGETANRDVAERLQHLYYDQTVILAGR